MVIVVVALAFAVIAPALALPAGAAGPSTTAYGGGTKPKRALTGAAATKFRRAIAKIQATKRAAAKRQAAKRAAAKRQAAKAAATSAPAAKRAAKKNAKKSSLSLPTLALLAVLPFLLIGIYLLAGDYWRRRAPRKRNASLVITRVRDR
ncbi:MAG: hypothetical protein QOG50_1602 [Actinomycetota bacterium]|nr:hypothetical protein [Actinomycetota bacterium]